MTHLSMRNLRSNNNIPQNLLFSEKNNFRKAVCTPVSMSQIQLNKILAKNWIVLKWSTGTCHCPHDDSCLPERKIWVQTQLNNTVWVCPMSRCKDCCQVLLLPSDSCALNPNQTSQRGLLTRRKWEKVFLFQEKKSHLRFLLQF